MIKVEKKVVEAICDACWRGIYNELLLFAGTNTKKALKPRVR